MVTMNIDRMAYWKGIKHLYENSSGEQAAKILRIDKRPVIIGGCGRSGTTLLLSVLSCHPSILAIKEETRAYCPGGYLPNPTLGAPFKFTKLYNHLMDRKVPENTTRWCEKTPKNVLYFDKLLRFYGEGIRIIQIVRDGRDVVISRHPSNPAKFWVTPQRWVMDVRAGLNLVGHGQVLTIRYEDLVEDYLQTVHKLCCFLGITFADGFYDFPKHARVTRNAAWSRQVQPLQQKKPGLWKAPEYKNRIEELYATTGALELLQYYGYEVGEPRVTL